MSKKILTKFQIFIININYLRPKGGTVNMDNHRLAALVEFILLIAFSACLLVVFTTSPLLITLAVQLGVTLESARLLCVALSLIILSLIIMHRKYHRKVD